jgi:hypothetical protein
MLIYVINSTFDDHWVPAQWIVNIHYLTCEVYCIIYSKFVYDECHIFYIGSITCESPSRQSLIFNDLIAD